MPTITNTSVNGPITVASGDELDLVGASVTSGGNSNGVQGSGSFTVRLTGSSITAANRGVSDTGAGTLTVSLDAGSAIIGKDGLGSDTATINLTNAGVVQSNSIQGNGVTIRLDGSMVINTGSINGAAGQYAIVATGATTITNSGTISSGQSNALYIDGATSRLNLSDGATAGVITGGVSVDGSLALSTNGLAGYTLSSVVLGGGSVSKVDAGVLTLTGADTYTGGTTVSGGVLQIGAGGATGSITGNVTDNATLEFSRADATTFAGAISGTGAVQVDSGGMLTLSNTNTYQGGTTVSGGATLVAGHANGGNVLDSLGGGTVTLNNGTLRVVTGGASSLNNPIAIGAAGGVIDGSAAGAFVNGPITGAGPLTLLAANGLALGGDDRGYAGAVTIAGGSVQINSVNALTAGDAVTVAGGATLDLFGFAASVGSLSGAGAVTNHQLFSSSLLTVGALGTSTTFSGVISNGGAANNSLTKVGAGVLTLTGANTYNGTTVSGGTLQIGAAGGTTGSIVGNVTDNATLEFSRGDATTFAGAISGTGAVQVDGGGVLTLSGANTYGGGTTVTGGATVSVATDAALGAAAGGLTLNGGTLLATTAFTSNRAVTLGAGGGVLRASNAGPLTLSGVIADAPNTAGGLTLAAPFGTFTQVNLTGVNTYVGATTLTSNTTLQLSGSGSIAQSSKVIFDVGQSPLGATFAIDGLSGSGTSIAGLYGSTSNAAVDLGAKQLTLTAASGSFAGLINDPQANGGLQHSGGGLAVTGGVQTLSGMSTYTGATTVSGTGVLAEDGSLTSAVTVANGGTLRGTGTDTAGVTVQAGGTFAPGDTTGTFTGASLSMSGGSTFAETITGANASGRLVTTGGAGVTLMAGANLSLTYTGGAEVYGTVYTIAQATGGGVVVGTFANGTVASGGHTFSVGYTPSSITLTDITNTAPTLSGVPASVASAGAAPVVLAPSLAVSDPDAGASAVSAQVAITSGLLAGDVLSATPAAGITAAYNAATGVLTLTGAASDAAYQQTLDSVSFAAAGGVAGTRTVSFGLTDNAGAASNTAVEQVTVGASGGAPPTPAPPVSASQQAGYATQIDNLIRASNTDPALSNPQSPLYAQVQAEKAIAAQLDAGQLSAADAQTALLHLVDGTTSVAEIDYAFFTGKTPTAAGLGYLVHSAANPTDLNDAYYQQFTTENRYINFAVNLATGQGAGAAQFQANYGALSLSDAVTKAYAAVFGAPPTADKIAAILNAQVSNGLGGTETRAQYFSDISGGSAQAQKAAAIGFLLADSVKESFGTYQQADQHFLQDLAHGTAAYNVDLLAAYGQTANLVGQPVTDPTLGS